MNQILMDSSSNVGKNSPKKSNKAVKAFAIILILFALALIGVGGYRVFGNYFKKSPEEQITVKPEVSVEHDEEEGILKVSVTHNMAIERIVYKWNDITETEIKNTGENTMSAEIQVPLGTNTITIRAYDIEGNYGEYVGEITSETGEDITDPAIALEITEDKKLKITATDNVAMQYVNYSWNGEDVTRVDAKEKDSKTISFEIEFREDKNTLTVIAVDSSNRSHSETKNYTGVTEPTIQFSTNTDNSEVTVVISHENGIKGVSGNLNGKEFTVRSFEEGDKKVTITLTEEDGIKEGNNTLEVVASSVDLTEKSEKHTWTKATTVNLVDTSDTGVSSTSTSAATEPKISVTQDATDKSKVVVSVSYNAGINNVIITVNNEEYPQALDGKKSEDFELELDPGAYNISVKLEGKDGITKTATKTLTVN